MSIFGMTSPVEASRHVVASEGFVAAVDLPTISLQPAPGGNCLLTVDGVSTFSGTIVGPVAGTTTALIFATCEQLAVNPPGTFPDVFRFVGGFIGTVAGEDATGELTDAGITRAGGTISALIRLEGDASALVRANADVAVGGSYQGGASL